MLIFRMFSLLFLHFLFSIINASPLDCSLQSCNLCTQIQGCSWCPSTTSCIPSSSDCQSIKLSDAYNCPVNSTIAYDDNYVRNVVYPLIGATKGSTDSEIIGCAQKSATDAIHLKRINTTCGSDEEFCVVDLYQISSLSTIAIIPHGSDGKAQINSQIWAILARRMMKAGKTNGKVLDYYANGFDLLWTNRSLEIEIKSLATKFPKFTFLLAGHSLGGSLSSLFATEMVLSGIVPSNQIQLITFGMPRTGDLEFVKTLERTLPYHFRVVNGNDSVPTYPSLDITNPLSPQHFRFEVFYPSGMLPSSQCRICSINEDPSCRNSLKSSDKRMHETYFGVNINNWYKTQCEYID